MKIFINALSKKVLLKLFYCFENFLKYILNDFQQPQNE